MNRRLHSAWRALLAAGAVFSAGVPATSLGAASAGEAPGPVVQLLDRAAAHMAGDDFEAAIDAYEQAIHVTRNSHGANDIAQADIVDALSEAYLRAGEPDEAAVLKEQSFLLRKQHYGSESARMLDAYLDRADWAERTQDPETAANAYQRIVSILEARHGEDDPRLIEPLMSFAFVSLDRETGKFARSNRGIQLEARRAVHRAVRIARAATGTDPALLPRTLVQQGDWMMFIGMRRSALRTYREAWSLLDTDPGLRDTLFAQPEPIYRAAMQPAYGEPGQYAFDRRDFPNEGFVELRYDVNVYGRPVNVEIIAGAPAGLLDGQVVRSLQRSLYRPAFRDGRPVKREDLSHRHAFRYDDDRLSERERDFIARLASERAPANGDDD